MQQARLIGQIIENLTFLILIKGLTSIQTHTVRIMNKKKKKPFDFVLDQLRICRTASQRIFSQINCSFHIKRMNGHFR